MKGDTIAAAFDASIISVFTCSSAQVCTLEPECRELSPVVVVGRDN